MGRIGAYLGNVVKKAFFGGKLSPEMIVKNDIVETSDPALERLSLPELSSLKNSSKSKSIIPFYMPGDLSYPPRDQPLNY